MCNFRRVRYLDKVLVFGDDKAYSTTETCHLPFKISITCHKKRVPGIVCRDYCKMFVEMSLRNRLLCFTDLVGMKLLEDHLRPLLPSCFLIVCLPALSVAVLKFCLPLTTSSTSIAKFQQVSTHPCCRWDNNLKVNLNFLRSWSNFHCGTTFALTVPFIPDSETLTNLNVLKFQISKKDRNFV